MSSALATAAQGDDAPPGTTIDADPATRAFYRLLDSNFGESWRPNDDIRYASELGFRAVDVIAPLQDHERLYETASEIETSMRLEHNARVLIFVVDDRPDDVNSA